MDGFHFVWACMRVCVCVYRRYWLGFVWAHHVQSEIMSCLCHSAPRPLLPAVRYICCASRWPGRKVARLPQFCGFWTFFCSPLEADWVLLCCPPLSACHLVNLTSLPSFFLSCPVFCRPSALPPSVHTCARFHPPCLFSSAGSTPQPTLKRRSSLWLYCHRIRAHVACRFPPLLLLPPKKTL